MRLLKLPADILDKYSSKTRDNLLLPMGSNQRMNSYLKEIADCCRIYKAITFHVARHTFATPIALNNGMPIDIIAKILGHTNTNMTRHYAKISESNISREMLKIGQVMANT